MKYDMFNLVVAIISIVIAIISPEGEATKLLFLEYVVAAFTLILFLYKNRKKIKIWARFTALAVYAVPAILLLIQRGKNLPMDSTMGRITIGMIAILMLVSAIAKLTSKEAA